MSMMVLAGQLRSRWQARGSEKPAWPYSSAIFMAPPAVR